MPSVFKRDISCKVGSDMHSFKAGEVCPAELEADLSARGFLILEKGMMAKEVKESNLKTKCPDCGGTNVHYKKGCEDCLDLNGDGKVDKKDAKLASKVLNSFKKRKKE